ncbi:hypothetical protein [Nocardioides euryhalodurans]|uniref:Uncharacterized protein n=1 Tax=Nocardioides euryhalodurans TaxID=2518370 RepID=A0A4P7GMT0_9ACTN|nr:hypothetical protein [Nocardioides euryhalodurans]QBR93194.1 hypothetical protein EXE57_13655 [Nocardioides euryhalodurans]
MFAVDPLVLTDAAARIADAAGAVSRLEVSGALGDVAAALPGSASVEGCRWLGSRAEASLEVWAGHLVELCESARLVARDAAVTDGVVADRFPGGGSP